MPFKLFSKRTSAVCSQPGLCDRTCKGCAEAVSVSTADPCSNKKDELSADQCQIIFQANQYNLFPGLCDRTCKEVSTTTKDPCVNETNRMRVKLFSKQTSTVCSQGCVAKHAKTVTLRLNRLLQLLRPPRRHRLPLRLK